MQKFQTSYAIAAGGILISMLTAFTINMQVLQETTETSQIPNSIAQNHLPDLSSPWIQVEKPPVSDDPDNDGDRDD